MSIAFEMYLVEIFLPIYDDEEKLFPRSAFDDVRDELTERFGGVTAFLRSPAEGMWKESEDEITRDRVAIFEVMVEELDRSWWAAYRKELERRFRQEEIIIRATRVERI